MTTKDILALRLKNQELSHARFSKPSDVVAWFGAMQAQDYAGAKWGLGQRVENATDSSIEKAFTEGEILRTHVMRPTWHFVTPMDIRWMLELSSPRVSKVLLHYDKHLGVDEDVLKRSYAIFEKVLQGKNTLTRTELATELHKKNIKVKGQALGHIVEHAELDGIICSGPRKGKQFTYMLLEERAAKAKKLPRDEALAELTKRYFQSHGPATVKDFVWWSGMTMNDVKKGIEMNQPQLQGSNVEDITYWLYPSATTHIIPKEVFLLPNYDEYGIAYKYREAFFNPEHIKRLGVRGNANFQHMIIFSGEIVGMWKRIFKKDTMHVQSQFFVEPTPEIIHSFEKAANEFSAFLGMPITHGEYV